MNLHFYQDSYISLSDHLSPLLITSSVEKKSKLANNRLKLHRDMKTIDLNKDYISASLKNVDWESKLVVNLNNDNNSTK